MAKEKPAATAQEAGESTLAEQLFAAAWRPENFNAADLARKCLEAAELFEQVKRGLLAKSAA